MKSKRPAKLELVIRDGDNKEKIEFGGVFPSRFQGSYGVSLTLPTGEQDENGYPVRDKIVAVKTAGGRKLRIDQAFVNLVVYEDLEAKPPYNPDGAGRTESIEDEDLDF